MRRHLAFLLGIGAGLAVFGLLRRRSRPAGLQPGEGGARGEGAAALRRRLAAAREEPVEPRPADAEPIAEGPDADLERARAAVHRDAHATLDEMRRAGL